MLATLRNGYDQGYITNTGTYGAEHPMYCARWKFGKEFDSRYLVYFPKSEISKSGGWDKARRIGREKGFKVKKKHNYYGWRKCHTRDYWSWYALDRAPSRVWFINLQKFVKSLFPLTIQEQIYS